MTHFDGLHFLHSPDRGKSERKFSIAQKNDMPKDMISSLLNFLEKKSLTNNWKILNQFAPFPSTYVKLCSEKKCCCMQKRYSSIVI